jgi:hypothetical protein
MLQSPRLLLATLLALAAPLARAADGPPRAKGTAPPDHVILTDAVGGAYFVARSLKEQHDSLLAQARALEDRIVKGQIKEAEARALLEKLRRDIDDTLRQIDSQKVLVQAAQRHTITETGTFPLTKGKCLFVKARKVRIVGHDEPDVKWVLEKTVLTVDDKDKELVEPELAAIRLSHRSVPSSVFSFPRDIFRNDDAAFAERSPFEALWNRDLEAIEILGLEGNEGNTSITVELSSPNGGASHRSEYRRHAQLTLFVPKCDAVAVQGALEGLVVQSLAASLYVSGEGYRDYDARCEIHGLAGDLVARGLPLDVVENVEGNVAIVTTAALENSGTTHVEDLRISYAEPARELSCRNIKGNFRAAFCRSDLRLENVGGQIDVINRYGDTTARVDRPSAEKAHRLISESGRIDVRIGAEAAKTTPIVALTQAGTIRVRGLRDRLDTTNFTVAAGAHGPQRNWRGFKPQGDERFGMLPFDFDRVLSRGDKWDWTKAVYLVSHAGQISLETAP